RSTAEGDVTAPATAPAPAPIAAPASGLPTIAPIAAPLAAPIPAPLRPRSPTVLPQPESASAATMSMIEKPNFLFILGIPRLQNTRRQCRVSSARRCCAIAAEL